MRHIGKAVRLAPASQLPSRFQRAAPAGDVVNVTTVALVHVASAPQSVARQSKRAARVRPSRAFNPGPPHIRRSRCLGGDGWTGFRKRPHHVSTFRSVRPSAAGSRGGGNPIQGPLVEYGVGGVYDRG